MGRWDGIEYKGWVRTPRSRVNHVEGMPTGQKRMAWYNTNLDAYLVQYGHSSNKRTIGKWCLVHHGVFRATKMYVGQRLDEPPCDWAMLWIADLEKQNEAIPAEDQVAPGTTS